MTSRWGGWRKAFIVGCVCGWNGGNECFEGQENIQPCESCMAWQWCRYEFIAKDLTTAQINSRAIRQSYFEKVRSW